MNKDLEMRKEKIRQEMKELKVEILNEYLQTAKEWDEALKVLLVGGFDEKRSVYLGETFRNLSKEELSEEEAAFVEVIDDAEANLLHKELSLMTDDTAIERQNEILEKYTTSNAYWEFIDKMNDLRFAYEDVKMAGIILE